MMRLSNRKPALIPPIKLSISFVLACTFFLICLLVLAISNGLLVYVAIQTQRAANEIGCSTNNTETLFFIRNNGAGFYFSLPNGGSETEHS
ncbi:MAG: hypothetical protein JW908_16745 [Anaerolineales bacterium]|nr:hypothetical protein [Anaerolineales bacterium]